MFNLFKPTNIEEIQTIRRTKKKLERENHVQVLTFCFLMKRIVLLSNITNFVEVLFDVIVLVFRTHTHTDNINECVCV